MQKRMDFSQIPAIAEEAAARLDADINRLVMHAWPQVFGSTAGPRLGGVAGAAMTTFQVLGFQGEDGPGVLWCAGLWQPWDGKEQRWQS